MMIVAIILRILVSSRAEMQHLSCLITQHVHAHDATLMRHTLLQTFPVNYANPVTNIYSTAIGLTGFRYDNSNSFLGYKAYLNSVTQSGATLNILASHDSVITNLEFMFLMMPSNCTQKIELTTRTLSPSLFGGHDRSDSALDYRDFYVPAERFDLTNMGDYEVYAFLTWIDGYVAPYQSQFFEIMAYQITNSSLDPQDRPTIQIKLNSMYSLNDSYTELGFFTLVLKKSAYKYPFYSRMEYHSFWPNYTLSTDFYEFTERTETQEWFQPEKCLIIFSALWIGNGGNKRAYVRIDNTTSFYVRSNDLRVYDVNIVCLLECPDGLTLNTTDPNLYLCFDCTELFIYCITCSTSVVCIQPCSLHIVDCYTCESRFICTSCYYGSLVTGGCTNITGCLAVQQKGALSATHTAPCTRCTDQFLLQNGQCKCRDGLFLVTGQCTSVVGCVSASRQNNVTVCMACNISLNLKINSEGTECICHQEGYFKDSDGACYEICGDGMFFTFACDDGNLIDGDGCNSTCQIEENYQCILNGTQSQCIYDLPLNYHFQLIKYGNDLNQALIKISVEPTISHLDLLNWSALVNLSIEGVQYPIQTITYKQGQVQLSFSYDEGIEGKKAALNIFGDTDYVLNQRTTLLFTTKSVDYKLNKSSMTSQIILIKWVFFGLVGLLMLLWVVSAMVHPMLGTQIMNTLQIIYLLYFQTQQHTQLFQFVQILTYSWLNFNYYFNSKSSLLLGANLDLMPYSQTNFTLCLAALTLLILSFGCLWAGFKLIEWSMRTISQGGQYFKQVCTSLLFSYGFLAMIYSFGKAAGTQNDNQNTNLVIVAVTTLLYFMSAIALGVHSINFVPIKAIHSSVSNHEPYPVQKKVYIVFIVGVSFAFQTSVFIPSGMPFVTRFIVMGLTLMMLFYQLCFPPYSSSLHCCGVFFNMSTIICFIAIIIIRDYFISWTLEPQQIYPCLIIVALFLIIVIISTIRLVSAIKERCHKQTSHKKQTRLLKNNRFINNDDHFEQTLLRRKTLLERSFDPISLIASEKKIVVEQSVTKVRRSTFRQSYLRRTLNSIEQMQQ